MYFNFKSLLIFIKRDLKFLKKFTEEKSIYLELVQFVDTN